MFHFDEKKLLNENKPHNLQNVEKMLSKSLPTNLFASKENMRRFPRFGNICTI